MCVLLKCVATVQLGTGIKLFVCVIAMCCYSTVGYRVTVMSVLLDVLLQYSWYRVTVMCVLL